MHVTKHRLLLIIPLFCANIFLTACDRESPFPVETSALTDASHSGNISTTTSQGGSATPVLRLTPESVTEIGDTPVSVLSVPAAESFGLEELGDFSFVLDVNNMAVMFKDGIALYNVADASPTEILDAPTPQILAVSQDPDTLAWVSSENNVYLWKHDFRAVPITLEPEPAPITSLAVAPQGESLAYATYDDKLKVWQTSGEGEPRVWDTPTWLSNLTYSPDGTSLGGADQANFVYYIFDVDTGEIVRELEWTESNSPNLYGAYIAPDWVNLAWVARSSVQLMNVATGELGPILNHEDYITAVSWSPDGNTLAIAAAASVDNQFSPAVILWDIKTGTALRTLEQENPVQNLEFSPDGLALAVMSVEGELKLWSVE